VAAAHGLTLEEVRYPPDAELFAPNDSGHLASPSKRERLLAALDGFAGS